MYAQLEVVLLPIFSDGDKNNLTTLISYIIVYINICEKWLSMISYLSCSICTQCTKAHDSKWQKNCCAYRILKIVHSCCTCRHSKNVLCLGKFIKFRNQYIFGFQVFPTTYMMYFFFLLKKKDFSCIYFLFVHFTNSPAIRLGQCLLGLPSYLSNV